MSKSNSPIKLFPRKEFEERVSSVANGTVSEYINLLLDVKNKTELDLLSMSVDLGELIDNSLEGKDSMMEKLDCVWDLWCDLTSNYPFIRFPVVEPVKVEQPESIPKLDGPVSKAIKDLVEAINATRENQSKVRDFGYKYLPTWPTVYFVSEIPQIVKELGYDPFDDLEKYAESVDQILPKTPSNIPYINPSAVIKDQLFETGMVVASKFAFFWNESNQDLVKKYKAEDHPNSSRGVASFGRLLVIENLLTQIQLLDESLLARHHNKILEIVTSIKVAKISESDGNDAEDDDEKEGQKSERMLAAIVNAIDDYEAIGATKGVAKNLGVCHMLLMLRVMFASSKNYDELMDGTSIYTQLCTLSPMLTWGLKQSLAESVVDEGYEDDGLVGEEMQIIAFAHQKFAKSENEDVHCLCKMFDQLNFRRGGISKITFLELANLYLFTNSIDQEELEANRCAREFMAASQDLIGWFYTTTDDCATPRLIQSLTALRNFGNFGHVTLGKHYDPNPIWAFSKVLLDEDDFIDEKREFFANQLITVTEILLNKGMVAGASTVFNFLMVAESIRMVVDANYVEKEKVEIRYLEPFGDWRSFKNVTTRLLTSGRRDVTEKAIKFAIDYLKASSVGSFGLALSELGAYVSFVSDTSVTKNAAEVIKLVQGKSNSIRERLISLMGEEDWNLLPSKIRGQVIQCEQVYDQSMGDQVLSGEPNYAWLAWYNTMVERMFKLRMAEMWSTPGLSRDVDASYSAAVRKAVPAPKFGLGSALYVCNGAAESGNRAVLNFLKDKGVDPHYVATNLSKELFKAIRIRNKGTHSEDVSHEEASEARRIFLTRLPDVVRSLGITDSDY